MKVSVRRVRRDNPVTMLIVPDTAFGALQIAAATLAVVAISLTAAGLRQQHYRGWDWWVAALWLATLGATVGACWPGVHGQALAGLLLLPWPLLALRGLRRFNARHALPTSERVDTAVLVAAILASAVGSWGAAAADAAAWLVAAATIAVHLYAVAVLFLAPGGRDDTPLQALGVAIALAAFAPGFAAVPGGDLLGLLSARAVTTALAAVVLAFVALTLVNERTERQLRESRRRLRVLANLDSLTQVPNRRHFHELATKALLSDRPGTASLLMFDIDHFKHINDHLGHAAGDRALCLVSSGMLEHLRSIDIAGRHGGDEFVLLLRHATTREAMGVAARIVDEVQARAGEQQLPALSLSFGMVQVAPGEPLDDALRRADQALYEAKRQGRSCAVAAIGDEAQPVFSESQRLGLTAA